MYTISSGHAPLGLGMQDKLEEYQSVVISENRIVRHRVPTLKVYSRCAKNSYRKSFAVSSMIRHIEAPTRDDL